MKTPIYLASPNIIASDIEEVTKVLKSGMLVQGKYVLEMEEKIAEYTGSNSSTLVSNGTATMHLALVLLGIGKGDEVIVPALSYVATANVVELVGATPVFVDVEFDTFNIDVTKIENKITPKTKVIIPVHEFGLASNLTEIERIAKTHNLKIIEDAACAIGAKWKNKHVGTIGDFGSFSFHPRKSITSGEGGCIIAKNKTDGTKLKTLRNHGIEVISGSMEFMEAGFNYRLTDIQAALLKGQFERLNDTLEKREKLAKIYYDQINAKQVQLPFIPDECNHTWQSFHIVLESSEQRNNLIEFLSENGIYTNYGAQCIPAMNYYLKKYKIDSKNEFPAAFKAFTCGLVLPLYEKLEEEQVYYISELINNYFKNA